MPAKKAPSEEDKKLKVRQEGRRGFLRIKKEFIDSIGAQKLEDILDIAGFQVFGRSVSEVRTEIYGYCPLFASLTIHEKTPSYTMRVDLSEPDPVIEMFEIK